MAAIAALSGQERTDVDAAEHKAALKRGAAPAYPQDATGPEQPEDVAAAG